MKQIFIIIFCLTVLLGCGGKENQADSVELLVLAAASMTDAMQELEQVYETEHPDIDLTISYASSGKLQRQIEQGAPADLFISAGIKKVDTLEEKNLIKPDYRTNLLQNKTVLITQKNDDTIKSFDDLKKKSIHKLSIGQPDTVPAGRYAKQVLQSLDLWNDLEDKIVFANDVRQVLTYVETGNVSAGLVYKSDTLISDKVEIVAAAPRGSHDQILYPMTIMKGTEHMEETKNLYTWLQRDKSIEGFQKYGFSAVDSQ